MATNTTPTTPLPPPDASRFGTADICDVHHPENVDEMGVRGVSIAASNYFKDFGGRRRFAGEVTTVLCYENNPLVRAALEEPGRGRVLVVDGGASARCALLGDNLAEMAAANGWSGIIVNGCVRDSEDIAKMDVGVKAIGTHPLKSSKRDKGLRDVEVSFAGVSFKPGSYVYADGDGVVVASQKLEL
jgi:regulator of ribonuclease activity A